MMHESGTGYLTPIHSSLSSAVALTMTMTAASSPLYHCMSLYHFQLRRVVIEPLHSSSLPTDDHSTHSTVSVAVCFTYPLIRGSLHPRSSIHSSPPVSSLSRSMSGGDEVEDPGNAVGGYAPALHFCPHAEANIVQLPYGAETKDLEPGQPAAPATAHSVA